jgi:AcrR family transcriptional regulator
MNSMARPRNTDNAVATTERILSSAEVEFATHGYAARLADISGRAGIRRPSLLYHFANKELLYRAVVERTFAELGQALLVGRSVEGSFVVQLESMTRAFTAYLSQRPTAARIIVHELIAHEGPGQALLVEQVTPLLDATEAWICDAGAGRIRPGVPVRLAVLQLASDVLLRNASGALRSGLWVGHNNESAWVLARATLLNEGGP